MRQLQNQVKNLFVAATIMNPSSHRKKLIKRKKRMGVFLKRKVPKKMILGWVTQHGVPVKTASFLRI